MRLIIFLLGCLMAVSTASAQFYPTSYSNMERVSVTLRYSPTGAIEYKDQPRKIGAAILGGFVGGVLGTFMGAAIGWEAGKGERQSLYGAIEGGIYGAAVGNTLLMPLGTAIAVKRIKNYPLALLLSAGVGAGGYALAISTESGPLMIFTTAVQWTISVMVGTREKRKRR